MREKLIENGWYQGSIGLTERLDDGCDLPQREGKDYFILLPNTCAIVSPDQAKLPTTDAILASRIKEAQVDNMERNARSPYSLVIEDPAKPESYLRVEMASRFQMPRSALLEMQPVGRISRVPLNTITRWIANHFRRHAWPDEFDAAFNPVRKKLEGRLKSKKGLNKAVERIYANHDPEEDGAEEYLVSYIFCVWEEDYDELKDEFEKWKDELKPILVNEGNPRIRCDEIRVQPLGEITLGELLSGGYHELILDYLSFREGGDIDDLPVS